MHLFAVAERRHGLARRIGEEAPRRDAAQALWAGEDRLAQPRALRRLRKAQQQAVVAGDVDHDLAAGGRGRARDAAEPHRFLRQRAVGELAGVEFDLQQVPGAAHREDPRCGARGGRQCQCVAHAPREFAVFVQHEGVGAGVRFARGGQLVDCARQPEHQEFVARARRVEVAGQHRVELLAGDVADLDAAQLEAAERPRLGPHAMDVAGLAGAVDLASGDARIDVGRSRRREPLAVRVDAVRRPAPAVDAEHQELAVVVGGDDLGRAIGLDHFGGVRIPDALVALVQLRGLPAGARRQRQFVYGRGLGGQGGGAGESGGEESTHVSHRHRIVNWRLGGRQRLAVCTRNLDVGGCSVSIARPLRRWSCHWRVARTARTASARRPLASPSSAHSVHCRGTR